MQICSNCRANQLDGTIFCTECGASMMSARRHETTASLGLYAPVDVPPVVVAAPPPAPAAASASGPSFGLVILNSGRRLPLDLAEDLLIGRKDEGRGIFPDIDLGLDGGYDSGVSRRHAILSFANGQYLVEDLGSANGTFVNGRRLAPQEPTALANGDELKCAMLLMRVEITQ